jgi:hypothetical protein
MMPCSSSFESIDDVVKFFMKDASTPFKPSFSVSVAILFLGLLTLSAFKLKVGF